MREMTVPTPHPRPWPQSSPCQPSLQGPRAHRRQTGKTGRWGDGGRQTGSMQALLRGLGCVNSSSSVGSPGPLFSGASLQASQEGRRKVKASGEPHTGPRAALGTRQPRLPARIPLRTRGLGGECSQGPREPISGKAAQSVHHADRAVGTSQENPGVQAPHPQRGRVHTATRQPL